MKKQTSEQLLKLMKIRTLLERTRHQAAQQHQENTIKESAALREKALTAAQTAQGGDCPGTLQQGAAHTADLLRQAKTRRHEAAAMTETVTATGNHVRTALRCELAAENLFQSSLAVARKARLEHDESRREQQFAITKRRS